MAQAGAGKPQEGEKTLSEYDAMWVSGHEAGAQVDWNAGGRAAEQEQLSNKQVWSGLHTSRP